MSLEIGIEGVLFYKAEPMKKTALAQLFNVPVEDVVVALEVLRNRLEQGGTRIVTTDTSVQLVTAPELSETIESVRKEELSNDLGKAGAETLAIVMYRGPLSRAEIDRIRGVNSTFILRNLMIRGLVERREHPTDSRSFVYAVTPTLLTQLGITQREDMPEFQEVMDALDTFEKNEQVNDAAPQTHSE